MNNDGRLRPSVVIFVRMGDFLLLMLNFLALLCKLYRFHHLHTL